VSRFSGPAKTTNAASPSERPDETAVINSANREIHLVTACCGAITFTRYATAIRTLMRFVDAATKGLSHEKDFIEFRRCACTSYGRGPGR
jgi:hypothetical protein